MADNITKRGGVYYFKMRTAGRVISQSLKTGEKEAAKRKAKLLAKAVEQGRWDQVFALKSHDKIATIQEIIDRYLAATDLKLPLRTMRNNRNYLLRIVQVAAGVEHPGAQPASVLTSGLMRKYQQLLLAAAAADEKSQDTACVSANSAQAQARSLFSKKVMKRKIYEGLNLGKTWDEFCKAEPMSELPRDNYIPPDPALVSKVWTETVNLKQTDPEVWMAFWMASMTGLRRKEIMFARWAWMQPGGVDVRIEEDFVPKGKRGRWVPVVPEVRAEALQVATERGWETKPESYLLPCDTVSKRLDVFRRLGQWMKERGWPRRQKAHELRKLFATALCGAADAYAAQMALGHQELQTTSRYAQRPAVTAVNPIKLYVLPSPEKDDSQAA